MTTEDSDIRDLIIIGSGPAGYTAAIYAARAQLAPLVFEGPQWGGALMTTSDIENFPGFPGGIGGVELMERHREQASSFGADLRSEEVDAVDLTGPIKSVSVGGLTYRSRAIILAMGAATRYLGVPGEQGLLGRGISSCATCDGYFFRGQNVAVVGGGDSAMEEALFLTRFAQTVTVIHRSTSLRASRIMVERAKRNDKIEWMLDTHVLEAAGEQQLTSLRLRDRSSGEESVRDMDGLFVAIGHQPRSALVADQLALDADGYVLTDGNCRTGISGVFACGDVVDRTYRQAITAAGSGCMAAIEAERWLAHAEPLSAVAPAHQDTTETRVGSGAV